MLIAMKLFKRVLILFLILPLMALFEACGSAIPSPLPATATVPTATLVIPANTELHPTFSPTLTPSAIPILSVPDGLRMVYYTSQGLYIKDGSNPPRQLTQYAEDYDLRISGDGEKIVFGRRTFPFTLYSINADGSDQLALVTYDILTTLNLGYESFGALPDRTTFVPGTHLLLFQTRSSQAPNADLLSVDTDTGEIKSLLPVGNATDYYLSPDGTKIAVNILGEPAHIDVISIDGQSLQRNIATYTLSDPIPLLPDVHWTQDSNSLTIVLPYPTFFDTSGGAPNYTIWRYALDENKITKVPLDPMPKDLVKVSPDGNWVTYRNDDGVLYVGNLQDGSSQVYEFQRGLPLYAWSPDNTHFIYGIRKIYLGAVNTTSVFFGKGDFMTWLDAERFLYYDYVDKTIVMGGIDGGQSVLLTDVNGPFSNTIFSFILLP